MYFTIVPVNPPPPVIDSFATPYMQRTGGLIELEQGPDGPAIKGRRHIYFSLAGEWESEPDCPLDIVGKADIHLLTEAFVANALRLLGVDGLGPVARKCIEADAKSAFVAFDSSLPCRTENVAAD